MNILVVYNSEFGNTETMARAIAEALSSAGEARAVRASQASVDDLQQAGLLIVGSPTQGFRPTKPVTNLLQQLPRGGLKGVQVAAFDTRIDVATIRAGLLRFMVNTGGYAAEHIATRLSKSGGSLVAPPAGFFVEAKQGPIRDGELDRAIAWAQSLSPAPSQPKPAGTPA